jgi:hypothetical protein
MKSKMAILISMLVLAVVFQNCGKKQSFDEVSGGTNNSSSACTAQTKTINVLSNANGVVNFELGGALDTASTEWSLARRLQKTETGRRYTHTFTATGTYVVSVEGFKSNCMTPSYTAEKEVFVSVPASGTSCLGSVVPLLVASPSSAAINAEVTVSVSNASVFQTSSLRWSLNGQPRSDRDGMPSLSFSSATAGVQTVSLAANQICNRQESGSLSVTIGAAQGAAILNGFSVSTLIPVGASPSRGTGLTAVYNVRRDSNIALTYNGINVTSANVSGTACAGNNCTLAAAQTSASACTQAVKTLAMTGANGQVANENFFIYCPATDALNSATCSVGRISERQSNEFCEQLTANPSPCMLGVNGQCATSVLATKLQQGFVYRLVVISGNNIVGEPNCFATATENGSVGSSIGWITSAPSTFRLLKGKTPSAQCGQDYSLFAQVGNDIQVTGIPQGATTTTTVPPVQGCGATGGGGVFSCRLGAVPGPGIYQGQCGQANDSCLGSCENGMWSIVQACGGQPF